MSEQKKTITLAPHLALTHELNKGAANGRNVSLLMKNMEELTDEQRELLKSISEAKKDKAPLSAVDNLLQQDQNSNKELLEKTKLENGEDMTLEVNTEQVKSDLTKAQVDLQKAQEDLLKAKETITTLEKQVESFENEKLEAENSRREELVKSVQKDEAKAEELLKSLSTLESEAFNTVIKAMQDKVEVLEDSNLFKQQSTPKTEDGSSSLADLLKAKHQAK